MEAFMLLRLDKILSDSGLVSRRDAARLIKHGRVTADGVPVTAADRKYDPETARIAVDGAALSYQPHHYFMMNKPAGVVSATEDAREETVLSLLRGRDADLSLFPAGRLDKDAEGLLLLTDDGSFAHSVISPSKKVDKTYFVRTDAPFDADDAAAFERGVTLGDGTRCRPARLELLPGDSSETLVTLREGRYHQVKRMAAARGKRVVYLKRVKIGGLRLDESLKPGEYRALTAAEILSVLQNSAEK
ncbi:MAG: rRNA pseudouridine synthase [Oscillospiraceae bacterium]|jgi:16S rRNA pseudouridine516 synthase|nr:rRNA pseudouridine synthase [Oscillospiraceae bacterium]